MNLFLEPLKIIGGPGSLGFLLATLVVAAALWALWPAARRLVRHATTALAAGYLLLATPAAAVAFIDALPPVAPADPGAISRIDTLVVFDGDNLAGRQRRAHQVLRVSSPRVVWLLGADYLLSDLRVAMAPTTPLHYDGATWNTQAQVERVIDIAGEPPGPGTAIIASRVQMPRIAALFEAAGASVLLIASPLDREPADDGLRRFVPSYGALLASRDAIYEHAALAWYGWRGAL